jgi:hypothetical protein
MTQRHQQQVHRNVVRLRIFAHLFAAADEPMRGIVGSDEVATAS